MFHSTRPTPKLRNKRGCVTCRSRRKKCDESKPSCNACTRLHALCTWPSTSTLIDRRERLTGHARRPLNPKSYELAGYNKNNSASQILSDPTGNVVKCSPTHGLVTTNLPNITTSAWTFLRSDREAILWSHYFDSFLPANILPQAYRRFSRLNVGDVPELRYCMLACGSIHIANRIGKYPEEALHYYTRTISGLRKKLGSNNITGREDWVFVVMILCHCFETWRCDISTPNPSSIQHLLGAIQLLQFRCTSIEEEVNQDFLQLMTESILFHVSTFLASTTSRDVVKLETPALKSLWEWIEIILDYPGEAQVLKIENHPVLATPWKLNRIIFEISNLANRGMVGGKFTTDEGLLLSALDELEKIPATDMDPYVQIRQLYIICARLLLYKMGSESSDCEISAASEWQLLEERALNIVIRLQGKPECWTFILRWPLIILGNILKDDTGRTIVEQALEKLWQVSSCGDVKRALQGMNSVLFQKGVLL